MRRFLIRSTVTAAAALALTAAERGLFLPGNSRRYAPETQTKDAISALSSRRIIYLGSSLTAGRRALGSGIPAYLSARTGCITAADLSAAESTLCTGVQNSGIARLRALGGKVKEADLLLCEISEADMITLGRIAENYDRFTFRTDTALGAMEYIISYARELFHCDVCFWSALTDDDPSHDLLVRKIKDLQEKWDAGFIGCGSPDDEKRTLWLADHDDLTRAGYRDWLIPLLDEQLSKRYGGKTK